MSRQTLKEGERFNHWTIIGFSKEKKKYIVKCICGKQSFASSSSLKKGETKSCGCRQKDFLSEKILNSNYLSIRNKIYDNYKRASKRRNYEFQLTFDSFSDLIMKNCFYCDSPPSMTYTYGKSTKIQPPVDYNKFRYNGVDRVDNTKGYNITNCVSCCKICNNSKSILSKEEWFEWIQKVYNTQFM